MRPIAIAVVLAAALLTGGAAASDDLATKTVPGRANIFGAGIKVAPEPGGGGGGVLPPFWRLPAGADRVVTFPSITGEVCPIVGTVRYNGPEGDGIGPTDVKSLKGISGIVDRTNGMFLVGVVLADGKPKRPAPARLDFTDKEAFDVLEPQLGQTFFIGDGKNRSYRVPSGATRLFVGFADAFQYQGAPGWYENNAGRLRVAIALSR